MTGQVETVLVCAVLVAAAVIDAHSRIIPNALVATLVCIRAARIATAVASEAAVPLVRASVAGLLAVLAVLALLAVTERVLRIEGGLGGGDVKLFCALGVCLGAERALATILLACVLGVAFSVFGRRAGRRVDAFAMGPFVCAAHLLIVLAAVTVAGHSTCLECEIFS